jgi:mannose-1-phosphate guanylyltransferase
VRWAVILAGGSGTRFWPLSTPRQPKQVLPLAGPRSPAEEAVARLAGLVPAERILLVTGAALAAPLRRQLALPEANVLVEPGPRSTGPALLWASLEALRRDPEATVLSLHADWHVPDPGAFREAAALALATAEAAPVLVTVGVRPTRAETGYGYVVPGEPLGPGPGRRVTAFREKPDAAGAAALIAGGALWNSGLFAWRAGALLTEVRQHTPEMAAALPALEAGEVDRFFAQVTPVSIDVGVLERSRQVAVVAGDFAWDDIGTWEALARVRPADPAGNVTAGPVTAVDARDNVVWSDGTPVVVAGVSGLVVVHANNRVLVIDRRHAADLKRVLDALPPEVREV